MATNPYTGASISGNAAGTSAAPNNQPLDVFAVYGGSPGQAQASPAQYDDYGKESVPAAPPAASATAVPTAAPPIRPQEHGGVIQRPTVYAAGSAEEKWNQQVRRGFTRKVLGIVFLQLLVTTGVSFLFFFVDPLKDYVGENLWVFWAAWALGLALVITISCSSRARRRYPWNYFILAAFTLVFSVVVGVVTSRYSERAIGLALAVTAATVFGAFCVAAFTKLDLTKFGGFLFAVLIGVVVMSIIGIFWRNTVVQFVIAIVTAVLFTAFLVYDLQLLMGGRTYELDPDEYVFASVTIYLDIINIFLNVLRIIGLIGE